MIQSPTQPIKVLSYIQPYGSLVAHGKKSVETRTWRTHYRGPLAVHASAGFPGEYRDLCGWPHFHGCLSSIGYDGSPEIPRGCILGVVNVVGCERSEDIRAGLSDQEREFGNYRDNRFGWVLADPIALDEPIPAKGNRSLWDFEASGELLGAWNRALESFRSREAAYPAITLELK